MLPGMDGLEVCRQLRRENSTSTTPIVMLTQGDEIDKVGGLEIGGTTIFTKPFVGVSFSLVCELCSSAPDYPEKSEDHSNADTNSEQRPLDAIGSGPLRIDWRRRRVNCRGQDMELQPKQFELLTYLYAIVAQCSHAINS